MCRVICAAVFLAASCAGVAASGQPFDQPYISGSLIPHFPNGKAGSYGRGEGQFYEISVPRRPQLVPLVIFIGNDAEFSGNADSVQTRWLPAELFDRGYAVAQLGHRESDRAKADGVMADLTAAIAKIVQVGRPRGVDPDRVVLVGTGSGAHFALLLGTDPVYFERAGLPFASLRAIIAINPAGFDVPKRIAEHHSLLPAKYEKVFGRDPSDQWNYSPAAHLAAPNVPNVMLFALDDGGEDFAARALEIAAALNIAGSRAQALTVSRDNRTPGTALGAPQHPDTPALFAFLGAATGKP